MKRRELRDKKTKEAKERQEIRDKLTPQMQLRKLDELEFVATEERARLQHATDNPPKPKKKKKTKKGIRNEYRTKIITHL